MKTIVTLPERRRRKLDAMRTAVARLDAALLAHAREHGGRFVRFGSSATGAMRVSSDVDLIVDFPDHGRTMSACLLAEALCHDVGLTPDIRPAAWCADKLLERALAEGVTLS